MKGLKYFAAAVLLGVAAAFPQGASAFGKGEKSVGVSGGYVTYNESGYVDVDFQWEFANHFRLAPDLGLVFENKGASGFMINCDMQFPFQLTRGFGMYPLVGLAFNNWSYDAEPEDYNINRVGANVGLGFDLYFTRYLKMSIKGKYSWMNDVDGGFFGLGLSYIF